MDLRRSPHARLRPLPLTAFHVSPGFWHERLAVVRTVTLPSQYEQLERTGRIDHFRRASGRKQIPEFTGKYYDDSDVYKWLEAASYALALEPDPQLSSLVERVVDEIAAAQTPDGYLNTYFTFERAAERWDNLPRMHQLYCAGHLVQAAVAHSRATDGTRLLGVATRFADLICDTFTPEHPGTDGHEEIELALVELFRLTGRRRYLDQAIFFLDQRGQTPPVLDGSTYLQDHLPVREQREIVGHAVRATYLAIGMADTYAESGDARMWEATRALWESAFERKAYVTGGLGASWKGEAFGADHELPNETAYAETCAAIGGFLWNWRMLHLEPASSKLTRYADWMETALYNGIVAGLSRDGTHYYYQNPLANDGSHRRTEWFATACCPPNIARLMMSLPGFVASLSDGGFWLHHYLPGELRLRLGALEVAARIETDYPWDGRVRLRLTHVSRDGVPATLHLRIPGWCESATIHVNGVPQDVPVPPGSYAEVTRPWRTGDEAELRLALAPRRVYSPPEVTANAARVALARGPLVYCFEGVDNPGIDLATVTLARDTAVTAQPPTDGPAEPMTTLRAGSLTAVPYYAWANRQPGQMHVWLRETG